MNGDLDILLIESNPFRVCSKNSGKNEKKNDESEAPANEIDNTFVHIFPFASDPIIVRVDWCTSFVVTSFCSLTMQSILTSNSNNALYEAVIFSFGLILTCNCLCITKIIPDFRMYPATCFVSTINFFRQRYSIYVFVPVTVANWALEPSL